jgi:MscS family membrane protein
LGQNPRYRRAYVALCTLLLCVWCATSAGFGQAVSKAAQKAKSKTTQRDAKKGTNAPPEQVPAAAPVPPPPEPEDPLGRTTPHGSVLGFLRAAEAKDYTRAAKYLDGRRSEEQGQELAKQLKILLDLGLSTSIDGLSRSPKGNVEDNLPFSREQVGLVKTGNGDLEVLLDQVKHADEPPIWLFSQETLNKVPAAYASVQHKDYSRHFPAWMKQVHFLSFPLWRWSLVLLNTALFLVAASLLTRTALWLLRLSLRKRIAPQIEIRILRLQGPIFGLLLALMLHVASRYAITALARHYWEMAAVISGWFSGAWLLIRLTDIFIVYERNRLLLNMQVERVTFIGLLGRFFKILVVLVVVIALLRGVGVDVSALMAGLGIGGVALALAAQKTLADLFGGLSVVMRGAVRVGDFCQIDGIQGTVEDIGISSLSLRTLDRSVVSIPNSKAAEVKLENFALRDQYWVHQIFTLQYDTPYRVVKAVLGRFVEILGAHPEIQKGSARATLLNLTATGPQIEVFAYFRRPGADYSAFLAEQERIILKMMSIVEAEGASLAAPVSIMRTEPEKKEPSPVDSGKVNV